MKKLIIYIAIFTFGFFSYHFLNKEINKDFVMVKVNKNLVITSKEILLYGINQGVGAFYYFNSNTSNPPLPNSKLERQFNALQDVIFDTIIKESEKITGYEYIGDNYEN